MYSHGYIKVSWPLVLIKRALIDILISTPLVFIKRALMDILVNTLLFCSTLQTVVTVLFGTLC